MFERLKKMWQANLWGYSDDEIRSAALNVVYGQAPRCSKSWIGGTIDQCDRADRAIAALRKEYRNYKPRRMRKAIMRWFDYFQNEADECRRDIKSQKSKRELREYSDRQKIHEKRVSKLMGDLRSPM